MKSTYRAALAALLLGSALPAARAAQPLVIGFGMALTGGLAPNGKAALLAMQIWARRHQRQGRSARPAGEAGLLRRPEQPVDGAGIYTKLLDVDKVDLRGRRLRHQHARAGDAGDHAAQPDLPRPVRPGGEQRVPLPEVFLDHPDRRAARRRRRSRRASSPSRWRRTRSRRRSRIVGADAEFAHNAMDGARAQAKRAGLKIVYDQTYPPTTADYTPIVRAIQATNPDLVFVASYPPDTVGMVRAANEVGLKAKLFGGGMVGLQSDRDQDAARPAAQRHRRLRLLAAGRSTSRRRKHWTFLKKYQAKAAAAGVDLLGYYLPPFAYADMQVLRQAVEGAKSLDQDKLADYLRTHTFQTIVGDIKFGPNGEWTEPRVLEVQFQGVKATRCGAVQGPEDRGDPVAGRGQIRCPAVSVRRSEAMTSCRRAAD